MIPGVCRAASYNSPPNTGIQIDLRISAIYNKPKL